MYTFYKTLQPALLTLEMNACLSSHKNPKTIIHTFFSYQVTEKPVDYGTLNFLQVLFSTIQSLINNQKYFFLEQYNKGQQCAYLLINRKRVVKSR